MLRVTTRLLQLIDSGAYRELSDLNRVAESMSGDTLGADRGIRGDLRPVLDLNKIAAIRSGAYRSNISAGVSVLRDLSDIYSGVPESSMSKLRNIISPTHFKDAGPEAASFTIAQALGILEMVQYLDRRGSNTDQFNAIVVLLYRDIVLGRLGRNLPEADALANSYIVRLSLVAKRLAEQAIILSRGY